MKDYSRYFQGYPPHIIEQVLQLFNGDRAAKYLKGKYPDAHSITSDKALYSYATELKKRYLKNALPFGRAAFKKQGDMVTNALGTHTFRMQGKTRKHDLAINSDLLRAPEPFSKHSSYMNSLILRKKTTTKPSYQLCCHMEPQYHQLELDLRIFSVLVGEGKNPY